MQLNPKKSTQRGDTLIEVLIATAILAMAIVTVMSIMQRGLGAVQESSERTQVQALMNGQANILRSSRDSAITKPYSTKWKLITDQAISVAVNTNACIQAQAAKSFYFPQDNPADWTSIRSGAAFVSASPPAGEVIPAPGHGLWVEGYKYTPAGAGQLAYFDFYIKACWSSNNNLAPNNELKTVVRLYDPS